MLQADLKLDTELIWKKEDGLSFVLSMFPRFKGYNPLFLKPLMADGLVVNLYIPHNRRTPLQAEEALGHISVFVASLLLKHAALKGKNKDWPARNQNIH